MIVKIRLNDQEFKMKYDVNAISELEEKMGKGIFEILNGKNIGFGVIRNLVWASLLHQAPNITPNIVGNWMNDEMMKNNEVYGTFWEKCQQALESSGLLGDKKAKVVKGDSSLGKTNPTQD